MKKILDAAADSVYCLAELAGDITGKKPRAWQEGADEAGDELYTIARYLWAASVGGDNEAVPMIAEAMLKAFQEIYDLKDGGEE